MLDIPILFICYKRHEYTNFVFNKILELKPKHLYVSIDGPRNESDVDDIDKVKNIVFNQPNTKYLIQDKNIGCERNILNSIDWIFSEHEEAIIIEEDVFFDNRFIEFIIENKHKVNQHDFLCISKLLYNSHKNDVYQFNSHGWYINKENFYSTYEHIDFLNDNKKMERIIKELYRPSPDSYKALYYTLSKKSFHWDEHLKYNIYFKNKKILYFPDEYTAHIGINSTNKEQKYKLQNGQIVNA